MATIYNVGDTVLVTSLSGGGKSALLLSQPYTGPLYMAFAHIAHIVDTTYYAYIWSDDTFSYTEDPTFPNSNAYLGLLKSGLSHGGDITFLVEDSSGGTGSPWDSALELKIDRSAKTIEIWAYSIVEHEMYDYIQLYNRQTGILDTICEGAPLTLPNPYHEIAPWSKYLYKESEVVSGLHLKRITGY